ncbi:hypothetical protein GALMADRAFT_237679 [Galerina marginata CBS 339.88]|uniref:RING-type domain-containing protein n=1 Tax=Galerina marginata (strain CBS 339.88) TaxID=685588 RepID=A0A067TGY1_GALM3|nr:hypothetical protein GALMADRAFT_237679 [Galerina marginata CBS 339.88]
MSCVQPNCKNRSESNSPTLECNHKLDLCLEHISQIVQTRVKNQDSYFECPIDNCRTRIKDTRVEDWINTKDDDYMDRCLILIATSDPRFAICPLINCPGAQYHLGGTDTPIVQCKTCGVHYCFKDRVVWKETDSHNCATYGTYAGAEMGADLKPCPSCKLHMTRISGCNHMTCSNCHYHFCWVCLREWDFDGAHGRNWYACPYGVRYNV